MHLLEEDSTAYAGLSARPEAGGAMSWSLGPRYPSERTEIAPEQRAARRESAPAMEPPVPGETNRQASERRLRNRAARDAWEKRTLARCGSCGQVRFHVSHEMDPATSPEGPEYHADVAHHAFVEPA